VIPPAITFQAPPLVFGSGVTDEIGYHLARLGLRSVLIITEPTIAATGLPERVRALAETAGVDAKVIDGARVEPTDGSCQQLADSLAGTEVDGYVAVGGGSSIDTAKILNLLSSYPGAVLRDYVNKPIGAGKAIPGPLKPLVAVPTTAGSGSECTAMVALGIDEHRVKTGIADRALTPTLALIDPDNTVTMPPGVTASTGFDVLTHACESYTCRRYDQRPLYASPAERPIYVGANPLSDVWAEQALDLIGRFFVRAVLNPYDHEARTAMSLATVYASVGFGNSGTHIPHANAYPIAGLVTDYRPPDYQVDHPMVPHGAAVVSTAPAVFEYTYHACPQRHLRAAELLGYTTTGTAPRAGADALPAAIVGLIEATGGPRGIAEFGYGESDIPALVDGAARQHRLLVGSPRPVGDPELAGIFRAAMRF
jgi:alcohol dehydrogenase class IV